MKSTIKRLDAIFSKVVRAITLRDYGYCPFCFGPIECCFHFFRRGKMTLRFTLSNAVGSCMACNKDYEERPEKYVAWFKNNRGQAMWDKMELLSHETAYYCKYELLELISKYKELYEKIV